MAPGTFGPIDRSSLARKRRQGGQTMAQNASFEALTEAECRRLLAEQEVGRVAFVDHDYPVVLPVNYVIDGNAIAIHSDVGTKFDQIPLHHVAFQVDGFDRWNRSGWSVLV